MSGTKSKLWSVDQEGRATSFLIGSIHVPIELFPGLSDQYTSILEKVHVVATETALDIDPTLYFQAEDWRDKVTHKKKQKWQGLLEKWSVPGLEYWYALPPIVLLNYLQVKSLSEGYNGPVMDEWMYQNALRANKQTCGLLTPESHYGILNKIPVSEQLKMLKRFFRNPVQARRKARRMLQLYRNSEMHRLYRYASSQLGQYRGLLLIDRNKRMVDRMKLMMRSDPCIFVIGAAHLSGERGILHLLKKEPGMKLRAHP